MTNKGEAERLRAEITRLRRVVEGCFLCVKEVCQRYGMSRATFNRRLASGAFPPPADYPGRAWRLVDLIQAEEAGRIAAARIGRGDRAA
jgi:hypothetical protein